ncbi:DUF6750 family protein [Marinobacter shengliensis]|uniref:DUF6750 family protein n=1 Tax=Marinobacter shengliensis TaxID=1389223 RepID=UPI001109926C|nr:DUF6750 family protein [Marinobacter shengliensis]
MKDLLLKTQVAVLTLAVSTSASAQESLAERITGEDGWIATIQALGMLALAAFFFVGVCCVGVGFWIWMKKSGNPQEPDAGSKAMKLMGGGTAMTIVPLVIAILAFTLGGDADVTGNVESQLNNFQN